MIKIYTGSIETPGSSMYGEVIIEEENKLQERLDKQYGKRAKFKLKEADPSDVKIKNITAQDFINLVKLANE